MNKFFVKKNKSYFKNQKGFTLVEMIIALAIFTIVAVVAIGALLKITDANRKSITLKTTINNLNFALESMSREIRVGTDYACGSGGDCDLEDPPLWEIKFKFGNDTYGYKYDTYNGGIKTLLKTENGADYFPLISPNIIITNTSLKVTTTGQPKVYIFLKGYSGVKQKEITEFALQTTISQRLPQ